MSFPSIQISFLLASFLFTFTPGNILMHFACFSPKKFLISNTVPCSIILQLMGKWAWTVLIMYRNPLLTPRIMLLMCVLQEFTLDESFESPIHLVITMHSFPLIFCFETWTLRWLKFLTSVPLSPLTVTYLPLISIETPAGMVRDCWVFRSYFIFI